MNKRLLAVLLSVVMILGLFAACGGGGTPSTTPPAESPVDSSPADSSLAPAVDPASPSTPDVAPTATDGAAGVDGKSIGVCIYKADDNFMNLYSTELKNYLEAGGATVQVMDGKNDQAEQTKQINTFISQKVDALVVNLVQPDSASQIADLAHEAGIPLVFINREPSEEEEARWATNDMKVTYVGADARQSGTFQGEIIAALPNKGDADGDGTLRYVMIMGDPENVDAQYRTEFSIKALEEAGITVEKLVEERGNWDRENGRQIAANALVAEGAKIDVILSNNDDMAMGALMAIEAGGRVVNEDIYLVGVDALVEALEAIDGNKMTGTVFNDHIGQSHAAANTAGEFLAGTAVAPVNMVDYVKVTPENASEIRALLG